jgi:hypothetical protein
LNKDSPIFIIGTERSGSNLLRTILNAHSRIAVPHPPHILHYFAPIEHRYGDLTNDANLHRLAEDVIRLLKVHIHPWEIIPDAATITRNAQPRDLFGIFAAVYDEYLAYSKKERWGCKSTFMIHYTDRILARYPDARLLWLVRDPRDVVVSSRDSVFNPFHPYFTAHLWKQQQDIGLALQQSLPANNILLSRYEDLIATPTETAERICSFLGELFEPDMLRYFETTSARLGASLSEDWKNIARPILGDNAEKFRRHLTIDERALIQQVAGETMIKLGYQPEHLNGTQIQVGMATRLQFRVKDIAGRCRVELRSLRKDRNHWRRWMRTLTVQHLHVRSFLSRL